MAALLIPRAGLIADDTQALLIPGAGVVAAQEAGSAALPLTIGTQQITGASIGTTTVAAIYKGETQLWP